MVCFPQHNTRSSSTDRGENGPLDDSQSSSSSSTISEAAKDQDMSTDMENAPLSQLVEHFKSKINANHKDDCSSNTDSEANAFSIKDVFSCKEKDAICSLDDYTTVMSSDGSNFVDVENLSTPSLSSCSLSIDSDVSSLVGDPKTKPKKKKRKVVLNPNKRAKNTKTAKSSLSTKAQRRTKREEYEKKAQLQEKPKIKKKKKKTAKNHSKLSTMSRKSNNDSNKSANDLFCLQLSTESENQLEENSRNPKSPTKNKETPLLSLNEDHNPKCTSDGLSSATSVSELFTMTSGEENCTTDEKIEESKVESFLESDLQIKIASISAMSTPAKSNDENESSILIGKKKLLQRDIRSMFTPQINDSASLEKSSVKVVEDQGCQTAPLKLRQGNKRRKLSASLSEYKSITTFMTVNESPPKRKSPKGKLQSTLNSVLPTNETCTAASTVSSSIIETMVAAKGAVIRALKRLSGPSEVSTKETDTARKFLFKDTDNTNTESCKNDLFEDRDEIDVATPSTITRKCIEDTDSDSDNSDSIKLVKVKKGRSPIRLKGIPKNIQINPVPNFIHEKFCACYNIHKHRRPIPNRSRKPTDPGEVIVIDDENDDEDSGKGSSRDTSDAGTKSGDGSGPDDQDSLSCNEDNEKGNLLYYGSCDYEVSCDEDVGNSLDSWSTSGVHNSQSGATTARRGSPLHSTGKKQRAKKDGKKSSKKSKTDVKKQGFKNSDQVDASTNVLSKDSSLGKLSFTEKQIDVHEDSDGTFESLDSLMDECTENNFKGHLKKKGKSHGSKKQDTQGLVKLSLLKKSNISSKKSKPRGFGAKKNILSLKSYMECSDEDFKSKINSSSRSKGRKTARPNNKAKEQEQTKKRKRKKSDTRENLYSFGNSSCTSTV